MVRHYPKVYSPEEIALIQNRQTGFQLQDDDFCTRYRVGDCKPPSFFQRKLERYIWEANNDFKFDIGDVIETERYMYVRYETGHDTVLHQDLTTEMMQHDPARKLSAIVCLQPAQAGGEIIFKYTRGINEIEFHQLATQEVYNLGAGDVLIFPSYVYHQVLPVKSGVRESIVALVLGPAWR